MTERLERTEKNKSPYLKVMRTLPEDAQTSDLGSAKSFTKKSCRQDGFHWSGLEQTLFPCMPCGCGAAIATASEQPARCADLMVWRLVESLGNCKGNSAVGLGSTVHAANHAAFTAKGVSL